jgi:MFS family permease
MQTDLRNGVDEVSTQYDAKGAWRTAILLLIFMLANFFDKTVVGLLAVPIMDDQKITPAQFGVLASSFFWLYAVGGIAGGFIANRVAARWLLLVLALAWSVCQLPLCVPVTYAVFLVARVALGFAEGPAYPVAIHAAYKWFPPEKRIVPVSLFAGGAGLGLLIAGVTVPLVTAHWGWRMNFVLLCALTLVWAAVWVALGREGRLEQAHEQAFTQAASIRVPYRTLLTDRTVVASIAMQFASYWGIALGFTWLPAYFRKGIGLDAVASGRLYAVAIAAGIPILLAASWGIERMLARGMSSRTARGRFTAASQLLAGATFLCFVIPGLSLPVRELIIIVAGAVGPISFSICPAILAEVVPQAQRGAILGISNSVASFAGVLAPLVTGWLVQSNPGAHGYEMAFMLCGALLAGGSLIGAIYIDPEHSTRRLRKVA